MPSSTPAKRPNTSSQKPHKSTLASIIPGHGPAKRLKASSAGISNIASKTKVDSTRATFSNADDAADTDMKDAAPQIIEISSGEESSDLGDSDEEENSSYPNGVAKRGGRRDSLEESAVNGDTSMTDVKEVPESPQEEEDADTGAEPSFGEMLANMSGEVVDVEAAFADPLERPDKISSGLVSQPRSAPSAISLGTVLSQALKTNDKELLESCFEVQDLPSVRATIERLPSPLAATLLESLAKRLHKRPGRANNLLVWVQWVLAVQGSYLACQPQLMSKIKELNRVNRERARGLQPLLTVKGKLDLLAAQVELRRKMQSARQDVSDDDEEAVIYVEGEEEEDDDEEEPPVAIDSGPGPSNPTSKIHARKNSLDIGEGETSGDDDAMPTTINGVHSDSEEEDDSEDSNLVDDEAEETEDDTGDEIADSEELNDDDNESQSESEPETGRRR